MLAYHIIGLDAYV